jgi:aminoglycoside N3'-acetyltransferase
MKTIDDVYNVFKGLGIKENFIIIHSDVVGLQFKNFSISKLWEVIFYGLGSGKTYLFPAFSFSFLKKKVWNYYKTQSEAGILSEYFRKEISSIRSFHPIHSLSIYGKNAQDVPFQNCSSSFGKGSVWEWLCKNKDVCNLSLGTGFEGGATICHYPEEYIGVHYRKYIALKGKVINKDKKETRSKFIYYGRIINKNFEGINNWDMCEKDLLKKKILIRNFFFKKNYPISIMNTNKAINFIISKLKKNKEYLGKLVIRKN